MKTKSKIGTVLLILMALTVHTKIFAQKNSDLIRIDKNGRMLWKENGKESFFWGVNYTTPFAHAYRQIARLGFDREKVIDADVYHLARMGVDAYRVHVWDCEISDSIGNLLENEHLRLLDYLISQLEQRGVFVLLTPIAYWGNGYPEQNEKLPGFSGRYSKGNVYTEPEAIAAQERYLKQFISHKNRYTGKIYKEDPMVVGFEVCNEPGHSKAAETTEFVKKMKAAIRSAGCTKPVFYNVTQSINLLEDFIKGGTDGVTFQWYPSGLVSGHEMRGNFLPHVDKYDMPFKNEPYFKPQARVVYEFDPADIGRSYMYPPVALSFKEAGMQWVSQFAYDPYPLAPNNTEYQTHFLNLAYAPQKALGFKIAGEIFRNPKFQRDRANEQKPFGMPGLDISYSKDLSELNTGDLFYYTNNTTSQPSDLTALRSIAGYGSSPVVASKGYGAYFLDKMEDGVWRLEVMPDAIWVRDPFSRATPRIENVVIKWNKNEMGINLPGLGKNFLVTGINDGNTFSGMAEDGKINVDPGVYFLSAKPVAGDLKDRKLGVVKAGEYFAPAETNHTPYFIHKPVEQVIEGQPLEITVKILSPVSPVKKLSLYPSGNRGGGGRGRGFRPVVLEFKNTDTYTFQATIPDSLVTAGTLTYTIVMESADGKTRIYPGGVEGPTISWEFYNPEVYSVKVLPADADVQLFSAGSMGNAITYTGDFKLRSSTVLSGVDGGTKLKFTVSEQGNFPGRPNDSPVYYVLESYVGDIIGGLSKNIANYKKIALNATAENKPVQIELSLIDKEGNIFTGKMNLAAGKNVYELKPEELVQGRMVLLPRPYPGFLPFWYSGKNSQSFSLANIERIQLVVPKEGNELAGFEFTSIILKN